MARAVQEASSHETTPYEPVALRRFREAVVSGKHWYIALLESIRLWDVIEETCQGRIFRYLIANEALDWLVVAERLCESVRIFIPDAELMALLFHGEPPMVLRGDEFERLLGRQKHHQYLNFFYGITVEEALLLVIEEETRKVRQAAGFTRESDFITNEAYRHVYGATKAKLLCNFREEKGYPQSKSTSLTELKEFTYWLFKFRIQNSDKARIASDTRKALLWLNNQGFARQMSHRDFPEDFIEVVPSAHV